MNDKKRMIDAPKDLPLLGQEEIKDIGIITAYNRRKRVGYRLKKIFFLSLFVCLTFFIIIVFVRSDLYRGGWFRGSDTDKMSQTDADVSNDTEVSVIAPTDTEDVNEYLPPITFDDLYSFDYSLVPENASAIVPMDLSMRSSGTAYVNNLTGLVFDANALLSKKFNGIEYDMLNVTEFPKVLIIHTHATEAYSEDGAKFYINEGGELARSLDNAENVVSLGRLMGDILNEKGISTVHCAVMHDSVQTKDSYLRSEKTILEYLEKYPSIELVIDLHRDSIMKSEGDLIKPVTLVDSEPVAQIMCVVGSEWSGESCPAWQDNLAIALKLREKLNAEYTNLCRPTELREHTYNQELSKYALCIKVGSSGNSLEEAKRATKLVADALATIIADIMK